MSVHAGIQYVFKVNAFVLSAHSFLPRRLINNVPICLHLKSGQMYNKIFLFSIYKIRAHFSIVCSHLCSQYVIKSEF